MLRGVVPQDALLAAATALSNDPSDASKHTQHRSFIDRSNAWYAAVSTIAQSMTAREISHVAWERQIGFLHLLEQTVRLIGFGISAQVEVLVKVLLAMLSGSQAGAWKRKHLGGESTDMEVEVDVDVEEEVEDKEEGVEGEGDDLNQDAMEVVKEEGEGEGQEASMTSSHYRDANQSSKVRSLSLLRLSGEQSIMLSCTILPALPCPIQFYHTLPYLTSPCPTLSYPIPPYSSQPHFTQRCHVLLSVDFLLHLCPYLNYTILISTTVTPPSLLLRFLYKLKTPSSKPSVPLRDRTSIPWNL
jgi:hypothetical protein